LDLAYVAAGRYDGFWISGLNSWDMAAGALLIQEAGGLVSDDKGGHAYMESGNIVAANSKMYKHLITTLNSSAKN
jgi:myo-inositol-1(or 4)-monophosphatase